MNSPTGNLTDTIRQILKSAAPDPVPLGVIYEQTDMVYPDDKKKVLNRLQDLLTKSREIERVSRGVYQYIQPESADGVSTAGKIWNLLRIRYKKGKPVTLHDMVSLCGCSVAYGREKMRLYTRLGICVRTGQNAWRMITDPVTMPADEKKITRLRRIREEKKQTYLKSIDQMITAGIDARMAAVDFTAADAAVEAEKQ